jgi:hypothetical protein
MARFGDLFNDEKIKKIAEIKAIIAAKQKEKAELENIRKRTDDLKNLPLREIILEDGDGKPALMGHINALAKRVLELEAFHFKVAEKALAEVAEAEKVLVKA